MYLFQSEWLREPPRPASASYAHPAYGMRYGRAPMTPAVEPASAPDLRFAFLPKPPPRRRPVASFDRAA